MSETASRLARVRAELPEGVTLVAVSKTHPAELIREAYDAGQRLFGESRPQELREKYELLPKDIEWHMIGHLQTNKIKYIAPFVRMIQSVDSARLAEAIQKEAAKCGRVIDILLEIHVAQEETKTGWDIAELLPCVESGLFSTLPNLRVRGVMGIATNTDDESCGARVRTMVESPESSGLACSPWMARPRAAIVQEMSSESEFPQVVSPSRKASVCLSREKR